MQILRQNGDLSEEALQECVFFICLKLFPTRLTVSSILILRFLFFAWLFGDVVCLLVLALDRVVLSFVQETSFSQISRFSAALFFSLLQVAGNVAPDLITATADSFASVLGVSSSPFVSFVPNKESSGMAWNRKCHHHTTHLFISYVFRLLSFLFARHIRVCLWVQSRPLELSSSSLSTKMASPLVWKPWRRSVRFLWSAPRVVRIASPSERCMI